MSPTRLTSRRALIRVVGIPRWGERGSIGGKASSDPPVGPAAGDLFTPPYTLRTEPVPAPRDSFGRLLAQSLGCSPASSKVGQRLRLRARGDCVAAVRRRSWCEVKSIYR